jgi:hypothetical protein
MAKMAFSSCAFRKSSAVKSALVGGVGFLPISAIKCAECVMLQRRPRGIMFRFTSCTAWAFT